MNRRLATLFAGAFVMGCAEMLVIGIIDLIAADLGISLADAGALVTANALGLAIGGPLLTLLTVRADRRVLLLGCLAVFIAANLVPVLGGGFDVFLLARGVAGAAQGLFIAAAITTATASSTPERAGRAMSIVISGFATASALGLPLGTLLGQTAGWRGAFAAVVAVAGVVLLAAVLVLPSVPADRAVRMGGQARWAFAPRVLVILLYCAILFTGVQAALTYLVPYLAEQSGITGAPVGGFLLAYGVATTVGSLLGGRFADLHAARMLVVGALGAVASLLVLRAFGEHPAAVAVAVVGLGIFAMGAAPSMQHRIACLAGPGAPLAASLPASAVNLGIASGALVGGAAIDAAGVPAAVTAAAATAGAAALLAIAALRLHAPAPPSTDRIDAPGARA